MIKELVSCKNCGYVFIYGIRKEFCSKPCIAEYNNETQLPDDDYGDEIK